MINLLLNAIPTIVCFKAIGKKFTVSSAMIIVLTSVLTDIIPYQPITQDILLISVFGGLLNGFAVSLCLMGGTSGGGTDFIAIYFAEKKNKDVWNFILLGNGCVLVIAGILFGWDKALYSIIFQFTSTQIIHMLHTAYKKETLFIVTDCPDAVYQEIYEVTNHSATEFAATGCYSNEGRKMLYSVVSSAEAKVLVSRVRKADPKAFINVIKTDFWKGIFIRRQIIRWKRTAAGTWRSFFCKVLPDTGQAGRRLGPAAVFQCTGGRRGFAVEKGRIVWGFVVLWK